MLGLQTLAVSGLLVLAGNPVTCTVPQAPVINVVPRTAAIDYDFSQSSDALTKKRTNTISPYAAGADTTTGGLRSDRPKMATKMQWGTQTFPDLGIMCFWYKQIDITIDLSPKISVAKEFDDRGTCREAILEHERKHVKVDREVINKYALAIGKAVQNAVNTAGALGPYKVSDADAVQNKLQAHIQSAVSSQELLLYEEMSRRQNDVDSLDEYTRVSEICRKAGVNPKGR